MTSSFFQNFWKVVGKDVIGACLSFLNGGVMPTLLNHTHISLIPKCEHLKWTTEFRPISLCNMVFKIVSKVITNRMKGVLVKCISEIQSAFVLGRSISNNIIAALSVFIL